MADENGVVHRLEQNGRPAVLTPEAMLALKTEVDEMTQRLKAFTTLEFEKRINELSKLNKKKSFVKHQKQVLQELKRALMQQQSTGKERLMVESLLSTISEIQYPTVPF